MKFSSSFELVNVIHDTKSKIKFHRRVWAKSPNIIFFLKPPLSGCGIALDFIEILQYWSWCNVIHISSTIRTLSLNQLKQLLTHCSSNASQVNFLRLIGRYFLVSVVGPLNHPPQSHWWNLMTIELEIFYAPINYLWVYELAQNKLSYFFARLGWKYF